MTTLQTNPSYRVTGLIGKPVGVTDFEIVIQATDSDDAELTAVLMAEEEFGGTVLAIKEVMLIE
jgi:hypothetical protein